MRLRLLPLLLVSFALAPAVLAENIDLRARLSMQASTLYSADPANAAYDGIYGWATANGTLTLINASSVPAERVTFNLAGGLQLVDDAGWSEGVTCDRTACSILVLQPGSISLPVLANWYNLPVPGSVETTSATISSTRSTDPDPTNNTAYANTAVLWQSNLTFDSLKVPSSVPSGKTFAILAECLNHGPGPATDMTVTLTLPAGVRYEGYLAPPWFDCAGPPVGGHGDIVCSGHIVGLTWHTWDTDLIQALVSVDPSVAPGTVLTMDGTLASTSAVQSPLTASASLTVSAPASSDADVSVAATVDLPSVLVGGWVTETYTVSNAGPHDAGLVTLDVRLPEGAVAAYSSKLAGWSFDSCVGLWPIQCTAATLPAGATMTLVVQLPQTTAGKFTSTAVATWLHGGPVAASNDLVVVTRRRAARH